jgi:integrase
LRRLNENQIPTAFILPGRNDEERPLSENAFNQVLKRLGYAGEQSSHGFRTTASTLLNEQGFNPDWIEKQLAHVQGDPIRAAYNAAEYEVGRRQMMQHWSDYLDHCRTRTFD